VCPAPLVGREPRHGCRCVVDLLRALRATIQTRSVSTPFLWNPAQEACWASARMPATAATRAREPGMDLGLHLRPRRAGRAPKRRSIPDEKTWERCTALPPWNAARKSRPSQPTFGGQPARMEGSSDSRWWDSPGQSWHLPKLAHQGK